MARSLASKPLRSSEFFDPGITSPISFNPPDVFFLCSRGLLTLCFFVDSMIRRSLLEGLSFNRPALTSMSSLSPFCILVTVASLPRETA